MMTRQELMTEIERLRRYVDEILTSEGIPQSRSLGDAQDSLNKLVDWVQSVHVERARKRLARLVESEK